MHLYMVAETGRARQSLKRTHTESHQRQQQVADKNIRILLRLIIGVAFATSASIP